jgi:hypothetical protein
MKDVHVLIQHFHTDRGKMSGEMEETLKQHHTDHQKMAQQMGEMLNEFVAKNQKEAHKILKEFRSQHEAMSEKQREELSAFREGLEKDVKQMMSHLRRQLSEVSDRSHAVRKEARSMVHGYRAEHKKGRQIWQEFAGGKHRSPRAMPLKEEEGEKEKTARSKPAAEGRQSKILTALEESPNGMTHKELAYAMGMKETGLNSLLSRMLKIKLIRRKKNLYSMA